MNSKLFECYGISGHENCIRNYIINEIKEYCVNISVDTIGNLYAQKIGASDKKLTIVAYMDEPGIIVTDITEDGYIKFDIIGRLKPEFLVSKQVLICDYPGIISLKAIHLTTKKERETPVKTTDLFIDIGAKSKKEVLEKIDIGDYGKICSKTVEFGEAFIKGGALAGRWGCDTIINFIKNNTACNLDIIFTTQREICSRGLSVAVQNITTDTVVLLDAVPAKMWEECTLTVSGNGAVIVKHNINGEITHDMIEKIRRISEDNKLNIQFYSGELDGPDSAIKKTGKNISSVILSIPVKYIDSPSQVCSANDIKSAQKLLSAFIKDYAKECFS